MLVCRYSTVYAGMDVRWLSGNKAKGCFINLFKAGQKEVNWHIQAAKSDCTGMNSRINHSKVQ